MKRILGLESKEQEIEQSEKSEKIEKPIKKEIKKGTKKENQKNKFFTTVTVSDFEDATYINNLKKLDIGIELALLTHLAGPLNVAKYDRDLESLKKEIQDFKKAFETYKIPVEQVRVHQPGGYTYNWFGTNNLSGYDFLKDFFAFCYDQGFRNYVIHAPYGVTGVYQGIELSDYKAKIDNLFSQDDVVLEVEEVGAPYHVSEKTNIRLYKGQLFEKLMKGQRATVLLDVCECGSVEQTIERLNYLVSEGCEVTTIHLHKDKHKFLTPDELGVLLKTGFLGNLVNEGFVKQESSFDEFVKAQSKDCIVPNDQRIKILKEYIEI